MANYQELKQAIADVIKTNGNQEITGAILQNVLKSIVSVIGENATFAGIAIPGTNPGTPDANVFYLTTTDGIYVNFGNIQVNPNELAIIYTDNNIWRVYRLNVLTNKSINVYPDWFDFQNSVVKATNTLFFEKVGGLNIAGFDKSLRLGLFSFIKGHSSFGNRIGFAWEKDQVWQRGDLLTNVNFNAPFLYKIDGKQYYITIDVSQVPDSETIYISDAGTGEIKLKINDRYTNFSEYSDVSGLKTDVDALKTDVSGLKTDIYGNGGLNFLKNPDDNYSEAERKIIYAIKNIGFYDVPEAIKNDDIFVRTFAAQTETTGGSFGQLVYFANKRIYNETNNWDIASILIAPKVPCDYQEHEFDVTVSSGEMAGLRIRVLIDYSVFAGTEFLYGTRINNKIVFNLLRTWNELLNDRLHKIETDISELQKENTYIMPMQQKNVVFAGSSNVWGDGFLFYSYLKKPIDWLYKSSGKYTAYNDVETTNGEEQTNDVKFMDGKAIKISGVGAEIKFKHKGSELNICQVIERTSDFALIGLYDGDTKVAEFTNHNTTIGSDTEQFSGDGEKIKFNLKRCFTYSHVLKVNGVSKNIILNTQGYGGTFPVGVDCLVIRSLDDNGNVIHTLYFKEAPTAGAVIDVSYNYGETICFVKSTVGETESGENESPYGDGTISYDPTNPANISSGLDFRLINEKSFYKFWFDSDVEREITLKIEGGNNPYFVFNFASSVFHNVMNAGIGGWTAAIYNSGSYINRAYWNIADYFSPDVVTIGLTGNDDWANYPRKIKRVYNGITLDELKQFPMLEVGEIEYVEESDTYNVTKNIGIIKEITTRSLKADEIIGSDVAKGDFVRIGTYTGDLRQVQTRRIETVDNVQGQITWAEPLHLNEFICIETIDDLVGQEISIRSIEQYMQQMELLISNIKKMVPKCKICLFNIYYVDMWTRDTAEYTYIQQWIAEKFDGTVYFVDAWKYARDYCENSLHSRDFDFVADGNDTITFAIDGVGHWEGIEVWVNNKNVYGKDCYPITGWYTTIEDKTGSELNWVGTNNYYPRIYKKRNFAIKWKQNIPLTGTAIKVKLATRQWSADYAHPRDGDYIDNSLGRALVYAISKI
jgi:hypothetical protein